MTHGKRHQRQFRSGSLQRKAKAQDRENKKFDAETERTIEELKNTIKNGTTAPNIMTLRAAAAKVTLDILEGR